MIKAIANNERVELRDIMTFNQKSKKRTSLNPKTLEKVMFQKKKAFCLNVQKNGSKNK